MRKLLLMAAALIAIVALPAAAGTIPILNETGTPGGGTCNHTTGCTFTLSFAPTAGQLLLSDPNLGILDVITFAATGPTTGTATLASDNIDGVGFDDPGDTSNLPTLASNFLIINEPASQTLTYTPTLGQPGFGGALSYTVTSDSHPTDVAEPSSLLLLGAGLLGVGGVLRRKLLG